MFDNKKIVEMYTSGMSGIAISRELGVSYSRIYNILSKEGVKTRTCKESHRIVGLDENFFEYIDNETKAYMLGFIFADGAIMRPKRASSVLKIDIKKNDALELFPKFYKAIGCDGRNINTYDTKTTYGDTSIGRFIINSDKICKDLVSHGVERAKRNRVKYPNIDNGLDKHFIRGFFDGDGCVTKFCDNRPMTYKQNGPEELLIQIMRVIEKHTGISSERKLYRRHGDRDGNNRSLEIGGWNQLKLLRSFMYDGSTIYLIRKRNIFYGE